MNNSVSNAESAWLNDTQTLNRFAKYPNVLYIKSCEEKDKPITNDDVSKFIMFIKNNLKIC